jgi:hypothetical protein
VASHSKPGNNSKLGRDIRWNPKDATGSPSPLPPCVRRGLESLA